MSMILFFTPQEWGTLHPIDREQIEKAIHAKGLTAPPFIFPYEWWDFPVATRVNWLLGG